MQHLILYIIIALAVVYAVKMIADALLHPDNVCRGCTGCNAKEELLKNYKKKNGKPGCYNKK